MSAVLDKKRVADTRARPVAARVAFVSGGMGGIGTAICRRLAAAGHTVVAGCLPDYVETELVMAIRPEVRAQIIDSIPMGRLAQPEEVAAAVAFLASEEAGYITGANISVNGGMHMM